MLRHTTHLHCSYSIYMFEVFQYMLSFGTQT